MRHILPTVHQGVGKKKESGDQWRKARQWYKNSGEHKIILGAGKTVATFEQRCCPIFSGTDIPDRMSG